MFGAGFYIIYVHSLDFCPVFMLKLLCRETYSVIKNKHSMLHTENVAREGKLRVYKYDILTLQKYRGGRNSPRGERPPCPSPNAALALHWLLHNSDCGSLALLTVMCSHCRMELYRARVLELNASDERGIQVGWSSSTAKPVTLS